MQEKCLPRSLNRAGAGAALRGQRGQALVIIAGLLLFLIQLLGLMIDSVRLFIVSAQAVRAAEAGALAGALYLPDYFDMMHQAPDGQYAQKRACDAIKQNGFVLCPVSAGQIGATVAPVTGNQYQLQVTVTRPADVFFLTFVAPNLATATVSRSAVAEYLPPIQLGGRQGAFGDQADLCSGTPCQSFWASINGPQDQKEQGDAYSPVLEEGPSLTATDILWSGPPAPAPYTTALGTSTNHPQYSGGPQPNPDQHSATLLDASGRQGYNYAITVPPGAVPVTLWIYNAPFDPGDLLTGPTMAPDGFAGYNVFSSGLHDQVADYQQVHYSLFWVPLPFERSLDQLVQPEWSPPSVDLYLADLQAHRCSLNGQQAYDPLAAQCIPLPSTAQNWTRLSTLTQPGTYRLVISTTGAYGAHRYALKLTSAAAPAGLRIAPWGEACVRFDLPGLVTLLDLMEVPASYAGKTILLHLYDLGDVLNGQNVGMRILDPSGAPLVLPASLPTVPGTSGTELDASGYRYNGLWVSIPIAVPASYAPAPGQDWWQLEYDAGQTHDTVTISAGVLGNPLHLVN